MAKFLLSVMFQEFSLKPGWDARYVMMKPDGGVKTCVASIVLDPVEDVEDTERRLTALINEEIQEMSAKLNEDLETGTRLADSHGKAKISQAAFFPVSHSLTKI